MRVSLNFSVEDQGDQVQFEAPEQWNTAFPPPLLRATVGGRERLFVRYPEGAIPSGALNCNAHYFEAAPTDVVP